MRLQGRKIAILMESDFYEDEIFYYKHRFPGGRPRDPLPDPLWGQERHHLPRPRVQGPVRGGRDVRGDERRGAAQLRRDHRPVGDRLGSAALHGGRQQAAAGDRIPGRAFAEKDIIKGIICHGMWLVAPMPELVRGRPVVAHNNLHGDVVNMGAIYTDQDVVIDGDLVTGRTGGHCHLFARAIIDLLIAKTDAEGAPAPAGSAR